MAVATTTAIAVAGLVIAAAGTAVTVQQQAKAGRLERKRADAQAKADALASRRARLRTIREQRIKRGQLQAQGAAAGTAGGSGQFGGEASLGAQAASDLGFQTQTFNIGRKISAFNKKISRTQTVSAIGAGAAKVGGAVFSNAGVISGAFSSLGGSTSQFAANPFGSAQSGPR